MRNKGFTLVEMLIASFIFSLLGIGMISLMRQGNKIWQDQESYKSAYGKAVNVISQISTDLHSMVTDAQQGGRLVIAKDPLGRTILVFTKNLRPDVQDPILRYSGMATSFLDPDDNPWNTEVNENSGYAHVFYPKSPGVRLLPSTGKAEVAYIFSPYPRMKVRLKNGDEYEGERVPNPGDASGVKFFDDDNVALKITSGQNQGTMIIEREQIAWQKYLGYPLYRGFITPPGVPEDYNMPGSGSLFNDFVSQDQNVSTWMSDVRATLDQIPDTGVYDVGELASWLMDFDADMNLKYVSFADAVIYVGVQYWNEEISSWVPFVFPENDSGDPMALYYDSNRSGFPSSIRITVTTMASQGTQTMSTLAKEVSEADDTVVLQNGDLLPTDAEGFKCVLVGNEWIFYVNNNGNTLENCYRGTRGTFAANHPAGTPVYWGKTIRKIIPLQK